MPEFGLGHIPKRQPLLEAAVHEVYVLSICKVAFIHEAHPVQNFPANQDATQRGKGDAAGKIILSMVSFPSPAMLVAVTEIRLQAATGGPDAVGRFIEVHHRSRHVAIVLGERACEPLQQLGPKYNIVVQGKDGVASILKCGLDALVCSRCKPDILGILQKRTALRQVGLDVGCSVIGRTAIDDIQSMVRVCLALQRGKEILQDAATVVSNRDNTNLHMPCAVPLEYAPQTKPSTERETVTVLPGCKR